MTITPPKQNPEDFVDTNPVPVSTEKWAKFGFYDRTLEKLKMKKPVLAVGFAYSCQEIEQVPLEMTDQSLDFVITEKAVLDLRPQP